MPEVESLETPRRVVTPPVQVFEEPGVQVHDVLSSIEEPVAEEIKEDMTKRTIEGVATLTHERLDRLVQS